MIYKAPNLVVSPRDSVSNVETILDAGEESISIAKLNWDGEEVIGIRWKISKREWSTPNKVSEEIECKGMPVSRGVPVWFVLPKEMLDRKSIFWNKIDKFLNNKNYDKEK